MHKKACFLKNVQVDKIWGYIDFWILESRQINIGLLWLEPPRLAILALLALKDI